MFSPGNATLLVFDFALLVLITLQPLSRKYDRADQGEGGFVRMRPQRGRSLARSLTFLAVSALVALGLIGLRDPDPQRLYTSLVASFTDWITGNPYGSDAYADHLQPLLPIAVTGYLITLAAMLPATVGRRLMILAHAPLFVLMSAITDSILGVIGLETGMPMGPSPIVGMFLQYTLTFILLFRLSFTTYELPRTTQVPITRTGDWRDNVVLACCLLSATGIASDLAIWLLHGTTGYPIVGFLIIISVRAAIIDFTCILLGLVKLFGDRTPRPVPGGPRPLLNVIVPAYNEEVVIERMLRSIDRAACEYGGPVHVVMVDDGSTDDTRILAEATIAGFQFASGVVLQGTHGGKSKALNMALAECTADFVYRVDADCALDPNAFVYSVPHFLADPKVGLVGALTIPKEPYTTWIDRMRALEQLFAFGFLRVMLAEVDAVPCVPGTFCAFRREAALQIDGPNAFINGMFGEDVDFTCAIARLGYRAAIDPRVISYEDVPTSLTQLRAQRWRWGIGGFLSFARFAPMAVGAPGPRFWFQMPRGAGARFFVPAHFFFWMTALTYCGLEASQRHYVLRFLIRIVLAQLPAMVPRALMMIYYRRIRILLWTPLFIPFTILKRFYVLESMLSVNSRPVQTPAVLRRRFPTWGALFAALLLISGCSAAGSNGGGTGPQLGDGTPTSILMPQKDSACDPGVNAAEYWIFNSQELTDVQNANPTAAKYGIKSQNVFALVEPGQTSPIGQSVAYYKSYAQFKKDTDKGAIATGTKWVAYDNEQWQYTPLDEQQNPVKFETLFANLAHSKGYKVILMPAQNLVPNFSKGALQWQDYLNEGLATTSAKLADIYEIQAQPYELAQWRSSGQYTAFLKAAVAQAKAANPNVIVFAGISTQRVAGADDLYQDYLGSRDLVAGYWLNVPKASSKSSAALMADQFLQQFPGSLSSTSRTCASGQPGS